MSSCPKESPFYSIKQTRDAGRCLVATRAIPKNTTILKCSPPLFSIILREYRREVCAHCFKYDRGRNLPTRMPSTGKSFCSEECKSSWEEQSNANLADGLGVKSWEMVEEYVKKRAATNGAQDVVMHNLGTSRPSVFEVENAWAGVEDLATTVREARQSHADGDVLTKKHRRALQEALESKARICDPDVLSLLLTGVLLKARSSDIPQPPHQHVISNGVSTSPWDNFLTLASTPRPYPTAHNLSSHISAYLILLALLPLPLLPLTETLRAIPAHESHNSFGIRSLDDAGDEFLGYGVWGAASLFNHSCAPNVGKARGCRTTATNGVQDEGSDGRTWTFWTTRDVAEGEELCISYLGGDEDVFDVCQRWDRLWDAWAFECNCVKCCSDPIE
jgi:hypothetical protein